jgi:amino acid transporter, AAT family
MSDIKPDMDRRLQPRHIMMLTLGGTIGSGIFKGSSSSIGLAGPGVIIPYLVGGMILYIVMKSLAELAVSQPSAKTLRDLVEPILGKFTGYSVGWLYWVNWVLVMAAEMAAAASFLQYWLPNVPLWVLALIMSLVMTIVNLFPVQIYGEMEYWLAGVKIATLVLFIVLGSVLVFGRHPHEAVQNLLGHGGMFPHGVSGLVSAMLVVMFSFGGVEMIGMTLGETQDPAKTIPRAVRGVIFRVILFYVLPILVILCLVPWNTLGYAESPFVQVFRSVGIPYVGSVMNAVLLTAVLSAVNTGMYATSRLLYAQAVHGQAPQFLAQLSRGKVPVRALLCSTLFLYVGVIVAFFAKGQTFQDLMVFPGYTVILVWILLLVSRMKHGGVTFSTMVSCVVTIAVLMGVVCTTPIIATLITIVGLVAIAGSYWALPNRSSKISINPKQQDA